MAVSANDLSFFIFTQLYFSAKRTSITLTHNKTINSLYKLHKLLEKQLSVDEIDNLIKRIIINFDKPDAALRIFEDIEPNSLEKLAKSLDAIYVKRWHDGCSCCYYKAVSTMPAHGIKDNFCNLLSTALGFK